MPEGSVITNWCNGSYLHKVDPKKRVPVPFRWRPEGSEGTLEYTLIIWTKHQAGTCLRVLTPDQYLKLYQSIDSMANSDPTKSVLKRKIGSRSAQVKLDSAGRITIPDEMALAAEIKGEAMMVGMMDKFEIWNPARYRQGDDLDNMLEAKGLDLME